MTAPAKSSVELWGEVARDAALSSLRMELDGLAAMFQVLGLGASPPKARPAEVADDFPIDNLPV